MQVRSRFGLSHKMTTIKGPPINVPIPEDLTVVQFILDTIIHPTKPNRDSVPWFIDDASGRKIGYEEASLRAIVILNYAHEL